MFLGMNLPSWKQFRELKKDRNKKPYLEDDRSLLFAESCVSLRVIFQALKKAKKVTEITVWVPDYFCNQTMYCFREEGVNVYYYPIDPETLDPAWKTIKEISKDESTPKADAFIFVHYFGVYHDASRAADYCMNHDAILIEDCAHVLYEKDKFGTKGDFVIYSPHKQYPVSDASILKWNLRKEPSIVDEMLTEIKKIYDEAPRRPEMTSWYNKKRIQKLTGIHRELKYFQGIHVGEECHDVQPVERITKASYNMLSDYTYENLKEIAFIRRYNTAVTNYLMKLMDPDIIPVIPDDADFPYMAVYSMKNVKDKKALEQKLLQGGYTVQYWPDLPYDLEQNDFHAGAFELSQDIFTLPVHQDIHPQDLIKAFAKEELHKLRAERPEHDLHIDGTNVTQERYEAVFNKIAQTGIPQEWVYSFAKQETEGWKAEHYIVVEKGPDGTKKDVGVLQVLIKKVAGIPAAIRVNRGPMFIEGYGSPAEQLSLVEELKKKHGLMPVSYSTELRLTPKNLAYLTAYGYKCTKEWGYPSSIVDLSPEPEALRKNLQHFWRKNLKHAESAVTIKIDEYDSEEIIKTYMDFLAYRQIPGIPEHILRYLFSLKNPPLIVLTAHNDKGEMIADKVLYVHGRTATSFIALNTAEGRDKNARTLLIFTSALELKKRGLTYYDLGGVDDIYTEDVAKFKRGMSGTDFQLAGEFIKF